MFVLLLLAKFIKFFYVSKFICLNLFITQVNASLAFSVQPVKLQVSAVARIPFRLNAHVRTVVFHLSKISVYVMEQHCSIHLLRTGAVLKVICSGE
jgi:hypothetical protein